MVGEDQAASVDAPGPGRPAARFWRAKGDPPSNNQRTLPGTRARMRIQTSKTAGSIFQVELRAGEDESRPGKAEICPADGSRRRLQGVVAEEETVRQISDGLLPEGRTAGSRTVRSARV